jgi:hypothetical protein
MFNLRFSGFLGVGFVLAGLAFGCSAASAAASAAARVSALADEFYIARAEYDPLLYATANGDSRYDDKIGLTIAPKVRATSSHIFIVCKSSLPPFLLPTSATASGSTGTYSNSRSTVLSSWNHIPSICCR